MDRTEKNIALGFRDGLDAFARQARDGTEANTDLAPVLYKLKTPRFQSREKAF